MKLVTNIKQKINEWSAGVVMLCTENKYNQTQAGLISAIKQSVISHPQYNSICTLIDQNSSNLVSSTNNTEVNANIFDAITTIAVMHILAIYRLSPLIGIQPMSKPTNLSYLSHASIDNNSDTGLKLEVDSFSMVAKTRPFNVEVGRELSHNNTASFAYHSELVNRVSLQLCREQYREIFNDIMTATPNKSTIDLTHGGTLTADLVVAHICDASKKIAVQSNRGPANIVVMDHTTYDLSIRHHSNFVESVDAHNKSTLTFVGTLHETINVYTTDMLASPPPDDKMQVIIVGYKGDTETDTGYIIGPYIPIGVSGIVFNQQTFIPMMNLYSRYGNSSTGNKDTFTDGSYYAAIYIKSIITEEQ